MTVLVRPRLIWSKMLTVRHLIVRIERRRLVRFRRLRVIRRQVVHLAVCQRQRAQFIFRTRLSPGPPVTKVTLHQEGGVGKATRPRRGTVITNGHGQVHVHKDRDPPLLDPRHLIKVALDLCRHSRKDGGRPVREPHLCVPRLHPTQGVGGRIGDRPLAVVIGCH